MNELDRKIEREVRAAMDGSLSHMKMTHELKSAILSATEESSGRSKKVSLSVALALALLLAMAALGVAATRFGMLEFNWMQKGNAAFVEHFLTVDET